MSKKYMLLQVNIERDDDAYIATCPALPGCITWGQTYEEAYKNVQEAIECHIEALQKLEKNKYAFLPKNKYAKQLKQPSVVAFIKDAP